MRVNINPKLLREITSLVEKALVRADDDRPARTGALLHEQRELQKQIAGWTKSLGRPDLDDTVRRAIESEWASANQRLVELASDLQAEALIEQRQHSTVDETAVSERLGNLQDALSSDHATRVNLELALHIAEIRCSPTGQVVMRTCKLGLVPDVVHLVQSLQEHAPLAGTPSTPRTSHGQPRRRTRLAIPGGRSATKDREADMQFAMDPYRFADLPDHLFWTDTFQTPEYQSWAERNADAVWHRKQAEPKLSKTKLAKEFDVSIPTIRNALKIAERRAEQG